jgi:hypothetical protein
MYRTEITNAAEPLIIEVPAQVVKNTRRKNSYHCAFAAACKLKPEIDEAIIHLGTAYIRFKGKKKFIRYRVGTRLRDQIVMFDRHGEFDAGEYTLSPMRSHASVGRRQGSNRKPLLPEREPTNPVNRKRVLVKGVRAPAKISSL